VDKEHIMDTTDNRRKRLTAALGVAAAGAASALLSLGAGISHATEFDPQPDPPGQSRGFNPQPEPPVRQFEPGLKRVSVGQ
jgi:hypothetical protein